MRCVVTGGLGFVGSVLCRTLVEHVPGVEVVAFDNLRRAGPSGSATASAETRPYDVPWLVLDHAAATADHGWKPERDADSIFEEIADHAATHADWLDRVAA